MNILLLNWRDPKNPLSGGAEYVTLRHCSAWVKHGHVVTWFSATFRGAKEREVIDGVSFVRRGNAITVFFYAFLFYLKHHKKIDIIIDEVHGIPFFSKLYAKKPIIVFIHEVAGSIWDAMYPASLAWVGKRLERLYLWMYRDNYFWTDAESTRQELISFGVSSDRCVAIPCPIGNVATGLPVKKNTYPTYLFVGRVVRMKGVEDVVKAFKIITDSMPTAVLWIIGDGEKRYVQSIHHMIKNYGLQKYVVWWGRVSEKKKLTLMRASHVLLHASVKEGWGLVVLEAASQGTPTVAYPSGGLRDTIRSGITGYLTKERIPQQLADQAIAIYSDKKQYRILQNNCLSWSTSFTWDESTNKSIQLLKDVYVRINLS